MTAYDKRPWLALYDKDVPKEPAKRFAHGLEMFDHSVALDPQRPLLHYIDSTLSAAEVDEFAAALAVALSEDYGVARGDRVMIQVQNMPAFVIAMIAAWRLGAILVPLNPMFREDEMEALIVDAEPKVLIELRTLVPTIGAVATRHGVPVIGANERDFVSAWPADLFPEVGEAGICNTVDLLDLMKGRLGQRPAPVELTGEDVAFLVYTSGTTGPAKGAMNLHRGVVFNAENYRNWSHLDTDDVCLAIAPLFHVTGLIAHIAVSLAVPMPLVLGYRFHPSMMFRLIEQYRATWVMGSITAYIALMNDPDLPKHDLSSLKKLWSGGQAVAPSTVNELEDKLGAYVHNLYGLTEVTSQSHAVPAGRRAPVDPVSGALSVGVPVSGYVVRVVDENGADLPVGTVGELAMDSESVVPGYWRKPEETAHAFPGGRLLTGDVGFMDDEGWFYVVDRKKDLIVASGFKIWPREVEDVLYAHPAVREAGVVGIPDEYRGETVAAFVSLNPGSTATAEEIIGYCRSKMAAYKYPRILEIVEEIPKNPNGKILRRTLRERALSSAR